MRQIYIHYGAWILAVAALGYYLSFAALHTFGGKLLLIASLLLLAAEPLLLGRRVERPLYLSWGLLLLALVAFALRPLFDQPIVPLDQQTTPAERLRTILLVVSLLSMVAGLLMRTVVALSGSRLDAERRLVARRRQESTVLALFFLLLAFIVVQFFGARYNPLLDLTPDYFSFSADSRSILRSLERPVQVTAFLPVQQATPGEGRTPRELYRISEDVRLLLEQLPIANRNITLEFRNADLDSDRVGEFRGIANGTIIFRVFRGEARRQGENPYIERRVLIHNRSDLEKLEREVLRALIQVSSPSRKLYFARLNGERFDFPAARNQPLSGDATETLRSELQFYNFQPQILDALSGWPGEIPDDAAAIFLLGPQRPYSELARELLLDYLASGGRLFVAADPAGEEDFAWLFAAIEQQERSVELLRSRLIDNPRLPGIVLTDNTAPHRITENLDVGGRSLIVYPAQGYLRDTTLATAAATDHLNGAGGLSTDTPQLAMRVRPFLYTAGEVLNAEGERGVYILGAAFEGSPVDGDLERRARLVFYSDYRWLTEYSLHFPANQRNIVLAADSLFWLTESSLAAALLPKERPERAVQVTDELKFRNLLLGVLLFPLATITALTLSLWIYRKRRRFIGELE